MKSAATQDDIRLVQQLASRAGGLNFEAIDIAASINGISANLNEQTSSLQILNEAAEEMAGCSANRDCNRVGQDFGD